MSWYKMLRKSDTLVIVEDQVSALKVAPHHHALALLGTHIGDDKAQEIKEGKYSKILLCLDNDATYEAIKLQLKLQHVLPNMYIVGLGQDIKDMNDEQFEAFLKRCQQ